MSASNIEISYSSSLGSLQRQLGGTRDQQGVKPFLSRSETNMKPLVDASKAVDIQQHATYAAYEAMKKEIPHILTDEEEDVQTRHVALKGHEDSLESLPSPPLKNDGPGPRFLDTSANELTYLSTKSNGSKIGFNRAATVKSKGTSRSIKISRKVEDVVLNMAAPAIISSFESFYEITRLNQALSDYLTLFLGTGLIWMSPSYFEAHIDNDVLWIFLIFLAFSLVLEIGLVLIEQRNGYNVYFLGKRALNFRIRFAESLYFSATSMWIMAATKRIF
ncbi:hypothetical protein HDU97_005211 [Phlyctochytrium planicorne]|nr:hypothetical protein HDU97_005211 [Phlyctochytrium planicorne]